MDLARFRGHRKALEEADIEYSDRNFFMLYYEKNVMDANFAQLAEKARDFTAVFCCSDLYAVMLTEACAARGIKVPEDLSVVGFDDNIYSRLCRPPLTTMHQDAEYKGHLAAMKLIDMIRGNAPGEKEITLTSELVVRESVRQLNR